LRVDGPEPAQALHKVGITTAGHCSAMRMAPNLLK
jgi:hypothetical protein